MYNYGEINGTVESVGEISGEVGGIGELSGEVDAPKQVGDYQKLINLPTINGTRLFDNYNEIDPTVPIWAKSENKPTYTASEVNAVNKNDKVGFAEIDRMFNAVFGTGI